MPNKTTIRVSGVELTLSNLDKIFYQATKFTKGQVIDYYIRVAPALLPHLTGRPVTFKRYPNGSAGKSFYQKECPAHKPQWLNTVPVWSESKKKIQISALSIICHH